MTADARISIGLPEHPKTKKLIRKLGQAAGWNLVRLYLWAAVNRSDGDLSGLSVEDIELAADWQGEEGAFVEALRNVRFLDGNAGEYELHDWAEHNPWAAGAGMRAAKARWNAAKRHHGVAEADRLVPEYAAVRSAQHASSTAGSTPDSNANSNADSKLPAGTEDAASSQVLPPSNAPSPSPSPTPTLETPLPPKGGGVVRKLPVPEPAGFVAFWLLWPQGKRKEARGKCLKVWLREGFETIAAEILAHVRAKLSRTDWAKEDGAYVEAPFVYLNQRRWEGADLGQAASEPSGHSEVVL